MRFRVRSPWQQRWHKLGVGHRIGLLALLACAVPASGLITDHLARDPDEPDMTELLAAARPPAATTRFTLCVDGPEFMAALSGDLRRARRSVVVQTLAFEADPAGLALAQALLASPAPDRRLLIDDYSRLVQSDKVVGPPTRLFDAALAREAEQTRSLITDLRAHGVDVRYGRRIGPGAAGRRARDHKKVIVVDSRVAYLGGINFSEHNFRWHDLMLRLAAPDVAAFLATDFEHTWRGEAATTRGEFDGISLVCATDDGEGAIRSSINSVIGEADHSIVLECPYITDPYLKALGAARQRGVTVTIITSENINRACMKQSIMSACRRYGLQLRLRSGPMTHVKALLVDDKTLVLGSANFDFLSATLQPEIAATIRDRELLAEFRERVFAPDMAASRPWRYDETSAVVTDISAGLVNLAGEVLLALHGEQ